MCRAGLDRHPSYLSARVTLGRALQSLGRADEARAEFERVIAVAPDNLAAIRALAELHDEPASPAAPASPVSPVIPALERWLAVLERERASACERL